MNGTIRKGRKVHEIHSAFVGGMWALCGIGCSEKDFKKVHTEVTCKKCLSILNKKGGFCQAKYEGTQRSRNNADPEKKE